MLLQSPLDNRHPVAYISRKIFSREVRYSTVEKEALAIKWALDSFWYYLLLGREFMLETDNKALQRMERMKDTYGRITLCTWNSNLSDSAFSTSLGRTISQLTTSLAVPARILKGRICDGHSHTYFHQLK